MPKELKRRLEREAKYQGVSINQLANYLMTIQLTHLESVSILESRLEKKSFTSLKRRVKEILDKVPERDVPIWDRIDPKLRASSKEQV